MNIHYKSQGLVEQFTNNRFQWDDFYRSERVMIDRVMTHYQEPVRVFDAECGAGGLGAALEGKYEMAYYCGVDINNDMIRWAKENNRLNTPHEFICADVGDFETNKVYDIVFSLSCIDYNIDVEKMLEQCWRKVAEEGYLIASIRLTDQASINDISKAYQYLNRDDEETEYANYVIFSLPDILSIFRQLQNAPDIVECYGYWHTPSETAVVPYKRLCMSVFAIHKPKKRGQSIVKLELPIDFFDSKKEVTTI